VIGDRGTEGEADDQGASTLDGEEQDEAAKEEMRTPNLGVVRMANGERTDSN
jgi:hypothetical protein